MSSAPNGLRNIGAAAVILCATLAAYLPALRGGLLWDDEGHVTKVELRPLSGLWRIWTQLGATQQYYPVLHTAFWVEHRLWGDATIGYHLVNILLHVIAACLVALILRRLAIPGGWLAALIFALHPVPVESVAWIAEQKNTLSTVFYLLAMLTYLGFDQRRRWPLYFLALGWFMLALLSKSVTVTLPAALLVVLWWRQGRLSWRRDVWPLAPWFALSFGMGLLTTWVERRFIGAERTEFNLTWVEHCLLAGRVVWFYLSKLFWPADLIFIYPRWEVNATAAWQYVFPAGLVVLLGALWWIRRRSSGPLARAAAAGLATMLFFVGSLFPALGFINAYPFVYSYVADHFQYLASLGIIVLVAAAWGQAWATVAPTGAFIRRGLLAAAAAGVVCTLGVLTWRQSRMYRDLPTLYRVTIERNPDCWMAHTNLGMILVNIPGRLPEAISEYEAALRIKSDNPEAHNNLGIALARIPGRLVEAIAEYEAALRIKPDSAEAHNNLGNALANSPDRMREAISEYEAALRIKPDYPEAHYNLGNALANSPGRLPEAIAQFEAALKIKPDYPELHNNLGNALANSPGRLPEAIAQFEAALRIKPDSAEAHNNLGNALARIPGRLPEAIDQYEAALKIKPDDPEAHFNLGNALARIPGRLPEAIAQYEAALRIKPDDPKVHNNLGIALANIPGRLPEAIAQFEAALRIKPDYPEAHYNLGSALLGMPDRQQEGLAHFEAALRIRPDWQPARQMVNQLRSAQR